MVTDSLSLGRDGVQQLEHKIVEEMKNVIRKLFKPGKLVEIPCPFRFATAKAFMLQLKHGRLVGRKADRFCFGEFLVEWSKCLQRCFCPKSRTACTGREKLCKMQQRSRFCLWIVSARIRKMTWDALHGRPPTITFAAYIIFFCQTRLRICPHMKGKGGSSVEMVEELK